MQRYRVDAIFLSKNLDLPVSAIDAMRSGKESTTLSTLTKVANYFDITFDDFVNKNLATALKEHIYKVPMIGVNLLDAYLRKSFVPLPSYQTSLPDDLYSRNIFAVTIDWDKRFHLSHKKAILVIKPEFKIEIMDMRIVAVRRNDGVLCIKRMLVRQDSSYILCKYCFLEANDFDMHPGTYEIIGEIIKIIFPEASQSRN